MTETHTPLDTVSDPTVTDPLSEVTRKERRALLGACAVGLAIVVGRLVPEEIQAFGITVSSVQEKNLLYLLAAVLFYFLLGFGVYASADLQRRATIAARARSGLKSTIADAAKQFREAEESWKELGPKAANAMLEDERFIRLAAISDEAKFAKRVSQVGAVRVFFDVVLPILIGVFSIIVVLYHTQGFPGWRWVIGGVLAIGISGPVVLAVRHRDKIRRWWLKKRKERRDRHFKKIVERLKKLPEDHPERKKLPEESRKHFEKLMVDLKRGII